MGRQSLELAGRTFSRLEVIERIPPPDDVSYDLRANSWWFCKCSCGNTTENIGSAIKRGSVTSCGCARRENVFKKRSPGPRIKFCTEMDKVLTELIGENKSWPYIEKRVGVCYDTCRRRAKELGLTKQNAKGGWFGYREKRTGGRGQKRKADVALINKEVRDEGGNGNMAGD